MECSLENASKEFADMIENSQDNLRFLQQLNATYESVESNLWGKTTGLVIDILEGQAGEQLEKAFDGGLSFDSLKLAVQMTALVRPEAFAVALSDQIDTLREFFEEERERLDLLLESLNYAIDKLMSDWNNLIDADFEEAHLSELNHFMNKQVPDAGVIVRSIKKDLMRLENDVYAQNITEELTDVKINDYIDLLETAKGKLESETSDDVVTNLIDLINTWMDIRKRLTNLTQPSSEEFLSLEGIFREVGNNFRESIEDMMSTLQTIREVLMELDTTDEMMFHEWNQTIQHMVRNNTNYNIAPEIRSSIDAFIGSGTPENISSSFPVVSGVINQTSLEQWEGEAGLAVLNKSTWISQIDYMIEMLENIMYDSASDVILNYDNIYEPLTDDVIDAYKTASSPLWKDILKRFTEAHRIIFRMRDGIKSTKNIRFVLQDLRDHVNNLQSIIDSQITYFSNNSPKETLETSLGLTRQTKGAIEGLTVLSDYLGLDHMSQLINTGNFGEAVGLSQEDADSINQLLNDLNCLGDANDIAKSAAIEIRKMVRAGKERKDRLQESSTNLIEKGIANKEQEIKEMQELSETLKSHL